MDDIIRLEKINKIYGNKVKTQVLFDIDLELKAHSFNAVIGQSGSGKSTLMNIIGTLDRPTSGTVTIQGTPTQSMAKNDLARLRSATIGFVFQFHYLLPEFTALENVLIPYRILHGDVPKEALDRANALMDRMGLSRVKKNPAGEMSGGQQQRTAIARALINKPSIILADEPTGNLDSASTDGIYDIFRDINEEDRTTFLIITHDRRIAQRADRIIEISDGRITEDLRIR